MNKVLVVDDSKTVLFTVEALLKENFANEIEFFKANDGLEALDVIKQEDIDLVISDVYMPNMDGLTFAKKLREDPKYKQTPLILTSAVRKEDTDKLEGFETGALDFLEKPINHTLFVAKLRVFLELIESQKALKKEHQLARMQTRQDALKEMLSMVAHQWRQPLSGLSTTLARIKMMVAMDNVDTNKLLSIVETSENVIQSLSEQIRYFQKTFNEEQSLDDHQINELVQYAVGLVDKKAELLDVRVDISPLQEANSRHIRIISSDFYQILLYIFNNSFDAFEEKNIENRSIKVEVQAKDSCYVLKVSDNAGGMKKEHIEKAFEPYFSTKSKNTRGLGLFLVRELVEKHGGEVVLKNKKEGVEVLMRFPFQSELS